VTTVLDKLPPRVIVLSDEVGIMGGAAKATLLLCEALASGGSSVELFATSPPKPEVERRLSSQSIRLRRPPIPYGSRFRLPARSNGLNAWLTLRRTPSTVLHAVGMQREVEQYLSLPGRFRTFLWETTEALPQNKFVGRRLHALMDKIEALLVPSRAVEKNARETYAYTGRTSILPFWVEDRGKGVVPHPDSQPRTFLFVGRMDEDKGFRFMVPAFAAARAEHPDILLEVCGSGDPRRIPELAADTPGVTARGSVSDAELDRELADCFAFVLPSLHEGYPLTLLEACSYGKPVIATTVGSIPEIFEGRPCAMLVPPGDIGAIERAMRSLLDEAPADYEKRCHDARALFTELCSPDAIRAALARAYKANR
jgi:glycosyltransferase involved in cell wall biosynthesis